MQTVACLTLARPHDCRNYHLLRENEKIMGKEVEVYQCPEKDNRCGGRDRDTFDSKRASERLKVEALTCTEKERTLQG